MSPSIYGFLSNLPYLKRVATHLRRQQFELSVVQKELAELRRRFEAENGTSRFGPVLTEMAKYLQPQRVVGYEKIRVGGRDDGGYIVLNDFAGVSRAYSLGIGWDVSFDLALAERGIEIHQFDHTIEKSPASHPRFTLFKKKIERVQDFLTSPQEKQFLKIDIEGSEWGLFENATVDEMSRFGQISGEFHDLDRFRDPAWAQSALRALQNLNRTHQLIHIHGNNTVPAFWYGKMQWPTVMELTYVLRSAYQFGPTTELFPGELDSPNNPEKPDYYLDGLFTP